MEHKLSNSLTGNYIRNDKNIVLTELGKSFVNYPDLIVNRLYLCIVLYVCMRLESNDGLSYDWNNNIFRINSFFKFRSASNYINRVRQSRNDNVIKLIPLNHEIILIQVKNPFTRAFRNIGRIEEQTNSSFVTLPVLKQPLTGFLIKYITTDRWKTFALF